MYFNGKDIDKVNELATIFDNSIIIALILSSKNVKFSLVAASQT